MSTAADRRIAYALCAAALIGLQRAGKLPCGGSVQAIIDALDAASRVEDGPGVAGHVSGDGMAPGEAAKAGSGRVADVAVPIAAPFDEPTPPPPATGVCHRCIAYCAPGETLCPEHRPRTGDGAPVMKSIPEAARCNIMVGDGTPGGQFACRRTRGHTGDHLP
jgi:hypothetical protein